MISRTSPKTTRATSFLHALGLAAVCALGTAVVGGTVLVPSVAQADAGNAAVIGKWTSIDDKTGQPGAIIKTWVDDKGILYGAIIQILKKDAPPDPKCVKCSGYFKDKPLVGLTFMFNLKKDGDEWNGGDVLDPESGTIYHCKVTPQAGGEKLDVRGYVGISALGRTQTWTRVH